MNEVLNCLETRRSVRKYLPKQITDAELDAVLRAGTYAPTAMGRQSPKIVVLQKPEDIARLERMNAAVLQSPDAKPFYGAPTVCLVLADAAIPHRRGGREPCHGESYECGARAGTRLVLDQPRARGVRVGGGQGAAEAVGHRGRMDRRRPLHPRLPRRRNCPRQAPQGGLYRKGLTASSHCAAAGTAPEILSFLGKCFPRRKKYAMIAP